MNKTIAKILRIVTIIAVIIALALFAVLWFYLSLEVVEAALIGGALGGFFSLLLKEVTEW